MPDPAHRSAARPAAPSAASGTAAARSAASSRTVAEEAAAPPDRGLRGPARRAPSAPGRPGRSASRRPRTRPAHRHRDRRVRPRHRRRPGAGPGAAVQRAARVGQEHPAARGRRLGGAARSGGPCSTSRVRNPSSRSRCGPSASAPTPPHLLLADETDLGAGHRPHRRRRPDLALRRRRLGADDRLRRRRGPARAGSRRSWRSPRCSTRVAKSRGLPMMLVGQVTKDSTVAGPRALEHIVDTTLSLDGDRHTSLRLLRAVKNRFGSLEVAALRADRRPACARCSTRAACSASSATPRCPAPASRSPSRATARSWPRSRRWSRRRPDPEPAPRRCPASTPAAAAMLSRSASGPAQLPLCDQDVFIATVGRHAGVRPGHRPRRLPGVLSAGERPAVPLDMLRDRRGRAVRRRAGRADDERARSPRGCGWATARCSSRPGTRRAAAAAGSPAAAVEVGTLAEARTGAGGPAAGPDRSHGSPSGDPAPGPERLRLIRAARGSDRRGRDTGRPGP